MMIESVSSFRAKPENHIHGPCPICKKTKYESNEICNKAGIKRHVYACMNCLASHRRRFGDDILDLYLGPQEINRLKEVVPDQKSVELDMRDAHRREAQEKEWARKMKDARPLTAKEKRERKQAEREELERVWTEGTVVEYNAELRDEIESVTKKKIDKKI